MLYRILKVVTFSFIFSFFLSSLQLKAAESPVPALTAPLPAKAGTQIVSPEWLLSLPKSGFEHPLIRWIDDSHIIYAFPPTEAQKEWIIESINIITHEHKILGEGLSPKPSPNGQWIAFIRGKSEKQLWIMRSNGSDTKQLSDIKDGLGPYSYDFAWSPDSKYIALSHQPYLAPWEKKPRPQSMIDVIDITTQQSRRIATLEASLKYVSWFANGETLLFVKQRPGVFYNNPEDYDWIKSINIHDGSVRTLVEFKGLQQFLKPVVSPDGQSVAFMYDADNPSFDFMESIGLVSTNTTLNSPPIKRLTHEIKLNSPQWSQDSKTIYVRREYGAYQQIYAIDATTGTSTQITHAPSNIESYALSPNGSQLVWIGQNAQATRVIRIASNQGKNVQTLLTIPSAPSNIALSEVREITWKTYDYPIPMRGLLFLPLHYQKGHRYPLIIDIHGGDAGAGLSLFGGILTTTPLEWHMWAAKGYAVFVPEFRSSGSFGSLAITRDLFKEHDRLGGDLKDIEAGVDHLIARGIVDPHRLAIIGHSAGGLRANWFTVATHRYRAIVSKEGWADELTQALKDPPSQRRYAIYGGTPQEVPQNYLKNSPLYHSIGATTPTLFCMGNPEIGGIDTYGTVNMLYNTLKAQKVETQYIYYPDEAHTMEQPKNRQDILARVIQWIDSHIKIRN